MSKKILVVDDDESILEAIAMVLEESGFTVETTPKGNEVYTKVNSFQPNIIVLDMLMSGNDGRTICKNLKAKEETKSIPILLISAHPNAKSGAIESGANDFLAKPFGANDLLTLISRHTN